MRVKSCSMSAQKLPQQSAEGDRQLKKILKKAVLKPHVISASVFSRQGEILAFAMHPDIVDRNRDRAAQQDLLKTFKPYVKLIMRDHDNLGYMRLRFQFNAIQSEQVELSLLQAQYEQFISTLILAFAVILLELMGKSKYWFRQQLRLKVKSHRRCRLHV